MKKCNNGHYYNPETHSFCPYCPQPEGQNANKNSNNENIKTKPFDANQSDKTQLLGEKNNNPLETSAFDQEKNNHNKTQIFDDNKSAGETEIFEKTNKNTAAFSENNQQDWNKTYIGIDEEDVDEGFGVQKEAPRAQRKLVGWLVSFTIDPLGIDFRLYEGKNMIGSAPGNEITVLGDKLVSSKHATVLFRNGKFRLKDEFSTNGTFLNGSDLDDEVLTLSDGDVIKVGSTLLKFRSAL